MGALPLIIQKRPTMQSNLTLAGWLLRIVSIVVLGVSWYVIEIVMGFRMNKFGFFMGGGAALIGGGAALLQKLGYDIIK